MKYKLIEAHSDLGVDKDGANLAPDKITSKYINNYDVISIDKIDIEKSKNARDLEKNLEYVNEFNKRLYDNNLKVLNDNYIPITIGGDHSIAIASSLANIKHNNNLGIIWIDSHGDFNNFKTTITGNLHGLPFAALTNYNDTEKLTKFHNGNFYNFKNAVLVGARDLDDKEIDNLNDAGITIFSTQDIMDYGVDNIMKKAFEVALRNTNSVHISYDIDVIDPKIAPGVSVKAKNGINTNQAYEIMNYIKDNKEKVKSLDLVEYNPLYDIDNVTLDIAHNLLDIFLND